MPTRLLLRVHDGAVGELVVTATYTALAGDDKAIDYYESVHIANGSDRPAAVMVVRRNDEQEVARVNIAPHSETTAEIGRTLPPVQRRRLDLRHEL